MTDMDYPQPTLGVAALATGGTVVLAIAAGLLQIPEVRQACLGVLRDPEVHKACVDASRRVGLAVAASWREHGKGVGPAVIKFLRSNWP